MAYNHGLFTGKYRRVFIFASFHGIGITLSLIQSIHAYIIHISSTYHPYTIHISSTYHPHIIHISSTYHPHIIHISSIYHPHIVHISSIYHPYTHHISAMYPCLCILIYIFVCIISFSLTFSLKLLVHGDFVWRKSEPCFLNMARCVWSSAYWIHLIVWLTLYVYSLVSLPFITLRTSYRFLLQSRCHRYR